MATGMLSACCPTRHITPSLQDSVRVETVVRTEYLPDTVWMEIPVEQVRQTVRDTSSRLETSLAVSEAKITPEGNLFHALENKPQKKAIPTEKEVIYRDSIVYRDRIQTQTVEVEKKLSWWQKTQMKGFWALGVLFTILIGKKLIGLFILRKTGG